MDLPGPDYVGWNSQVDLENIKLKVVLNEGRNNFDYNFWQHQIQDIERKPYLEDAAEQLQDVMGDSEENPQIVRDNINAILKANNIRGNISISKLDGNAPSNQININVQEDRSRSSRREIKRVYRDAQ